MDVGPNFVIWGTNVVINKCKQKFKKFVEEFVDETPAEDEISEGIDSSLPLYLQKLQEVNKYNFYNRLLFSLTYVLLNLNNVGIIGKDFRTAFFEFKLCSFGKL